MKRNINRVQWLALMGVVGTVFNFLHVILGEINYPGYNPLAQAVSDLTAATAPSREKPRLTRRSTLFSPSQLVPYYVCFIREG